MVLSPEYIVLDITDIYVKRLGLRRQDLVGRSLLEVFPSSSETHIENENSRRAIDLAFESKKIQCLAPQRYDQMINGKLEERY